MDQSRAADGDDAAAGRGVAHHDVVQARLGEEGEPAQQALGPPEATAGYWKLLAPQFRGMAVDLVERCPEAREVFDRGREVLIQAKESLTLALRC